MNLTITSTQYLIPVITGGVLAIALISFIIYFILLYRKSQTKLHLERERIKQELLRVENEVQEQTLSNVSRELHDNLGQIASLIKINLNMLSARLEGEDLEQVKESVELMKQLISDMKALSVSLKGERIQELGWINTIREEVRRVNAIGGMQVELIVDGESHMKHEHEVILFRILQEGLNNALKHSKSNTAELKIACNENFTEITLEDNGTGFDMQKVKLGSGLNNLRDRCEMINAELSIQSSKGAGALINIKLVNT